MKKLDLYILKRYFTTFLFTLLILTPIAIVIDIADKIGKFLAKPDLTAYQIIVDYYFNFVINYANTFMPLALFISVIMFTSKLADNTEIIAINSSGISFKRFLRPYFIGATIVAIFALGMTHFIVPKANKVLDDFAIQFLKKGWTVKKWVNNGILQLGKGNYVYVKSFDLRNNRGFDFTYEHYEHNKLKFKLTAANIRYIKRDTTFFLTNYKKRTILNNEDIIETGKKMDTTFNFVPRDFQAVKNLARQINTPDLIDFIKNAKARGIKNLNSYYVQLYGRTSLPVSTFILT
ncbi:MAG: LptF/LptG family permease, partial [Flavobacteriaceae bacterium]